jgi:hypothetical protein
MPSVVKTINSPRRTQRNTEKKTTVPLRALCGKNDKFTTENTEKYRKKTSVPLRALCGKTKNSPQRAQRNTEIRRSVPPLW